MLTAENIIFSIEKILFHLRLTELDIGLITMNFSHCAGLLHLLSYLTIGCAMVTGESPTMIGSFLKSIKSRKVTILPGTPSFFSLLLRFPKNKIADFLKSIRVIELSSANSNASLVKNIEDFAPNARLFNTYGLTEAPRITYTELTPAHQQLEVPVGKACEGVTIHLEWTDDSPYRGHRIGEIYIQGPNVTAGYWQQSQTGRSAFTPMGFKTGDLGYLDETGCLFLLGRQDDQIKIGREKFYPQEIENLLLTCPGVREALVYVLSDKICGNQVVAKVVRAKEQIREQGILNFCSGKMESFKIPQKIIFCEYIAVTSSGKPKREAEQHL